MTAVRTEHVSAAPPHPLSPDPSCPRPSPHHHGHSEHRSIAAAELIQSFQELQGRRLIVLHRLVCARVCVRVRLCACVFLWSRFAVFAAKSHPPVNRGSLLGSSLMSKRGRRLLSLSLSLSHTKPQTFGGGTPSPTLQRLRASSPPSPSYPPPFRISMSTCACRRRP